MKQIQSLLRLLPAAVLALVLALPARAALQTMDPASFTMVSTLNITMQQGTQRIIRISDPNLGPEENIDCWIQGNAVTVSPAEAASTAACSVANFAPPVICATAVAAV